MTPLTLRSVVVAAKNQVSCELGGEAAILDLASGTYYGLNDVGARIWALVAEPRTVGDVLDHIVREYDVEAQCCEADLIRILQQLADERLVEIRDDAR